ncbi:rasGAP-activating-like protein 1 isoform X2 [Oryzias melastigma]|uniref:RAS protein activator like 1 n=1 Tax=Oryzias melastigma TaxID=30732 RepID=A0A3B3C3W0_ORYME|nr:rasGAP-activating-like protein 1 isoform X1 [Oryzias melastigma]XP_024131254.1 rasGAP-activating-like protein 1 isoform X2 [Oryzias melastigma]
MAKNTSLYFRIVEGRNLPAKDVSGTSDPYCIVKVDSEVVARTATVWKNLNPFWGEEYTLHLPMGFHSLSFLVMDEDTIGHDDVIGKITLSKDAIGSQAKGIDSWLNLTRVDPDDDVQGEIHLSLQLLEGPKKPTLRCQIIEARDLAPRDISGTSDPFARVIFNSRSAETSIIKRTRFPHWGETLELELDSEGLSEQQGTVTVEVWDWDMVGKNDFLGKVEFPVACLHKTPLLEGWFRLLPLGNNEVDVGGKLGALRLKVRLVEDRILPSMYYQPLIDLLVESVISPAEVEDSSALTMLEEVTTVESRQDVAMTLVKIYLGQGLVVPFLDYLNTREVNHTTDPNTLFRSNSLASKAMEQFMKAVGMLYLHEVLKPIINRIFDERKYIELDPCKIDLNRSRRISFKGAVSEAEVRDNSAEMLQGYLTSIIESIVSSVDQCPSVMRVAFKQLHKRVEEQFTEPENEDVKYLAISGFFFLRFFAPAILTPKLFHLRDQHADTRTSRTLLLLAKALQSVGNLGLQLGHGKEQWMAPLHPIILRSVACVKDFLDKLIDIDHDTVSEVPQRAILLPSVIVKEGYLHKHKAEGTQLLSRFAFKKRYFWLTSETLSYAKTSEWQVRSSIPVRCVCAVERVDENAFQQQNVMQVISQNNDGQLQTMYIQCKNVNELNQWLSAIRKASIYNERMLPSFHPGAHRSGKWTCCLQADRAVPGCSRTHSAVTLGDWSDPLDPDVETQMIFKQLLQGRDKLRKKYLEMPDDDQTSNKEIRINSDVNPDGAESIPQLMKTGQSVAARLLVVIEDLEQAHVTFQHREKEDTPSVILNP